MLKDAVNLEVVYIESDLLTDRSMETLCGLPNLVSLLLDEVPLVTDIGIAQLERRRELAELYLIGTHLTDRGVESFKHLNGLWSLHLDRTLITDGGVASLGTMRDLRLLSLRGTQVVGYGLCGLFNNPHLDIYLDGCPIDDAAIVEAAHHLPGLNRLSLMDTPVTDACLPALASLEKLQLLRLSGTSITDEGLLHLCGRRTPMTLEVYSTAVTTQAAAKIRATSNEVLLTGVGKKI
ncbi:leucine-rich repeat domain-containing protein [Thalassoglobus neptunius]|nr:hypothetical protein [Thalassoglobus neptunius]